VLRPFLGRAFCAAADCTGSPAHCADFLAQRLHLKMTWNRPPFAQECSVASFSRRKVIYSLGTEEDSMNWKKHILAMAIVTGVSLFGLASTAQAQSFRNVDKLARQLERQTRDMHKEVHEHFQASPQYQHLEADVTKMQKLAQHMHDLVDRNGNARHLRQDMNELDQVYHHIQGLVREMAQSRQLNFQAFRHFREDLQRIETTLHHLRADVEPVGVPGNNHRFVR
jgi:hypothetical protein